MDTSKVIDYFSADPVVDHYVKATANVGLWRSEEAIFQKVFPNREATLLELGTGTGRIAIGLHELGYQHIMAIDPVKPMIEEARRMARLLEYGIHFQVGDATALSYSDEDFDGAIFGFNGLMQIPKRENRQKALRETLRVLRPGAYFVFTTHDRELNKHKAHWTKEKRRWDRGKQDSDIDEFGDRYEDTPLGKLFIHVPTPAEVRAELKDAGFRIEADLLRSQIANEPPDVREFSDECRFWIAQKPA